MYEIETYDEALDQLGALPHEALLHYAEVLGLLKLAPWSGDPYHPDRPTSPMRRFIFGPAGAGMVVYLVLERDRRVDIIGVHWLG